MTNETKPIQTKKIKLQLVGLDGNAFSIMGAFSRQAKKEGWSQDEITAVLMKHVPIDVSARLVDATYGRWLSPESDPDSCGFLLVWMKGGSPAIVNVEEYDVGKLRMAYWEDGEEKDMADTFEWEKWMPIYAPKEPKS